jgi:hypothetical protein
MSSAQQLKKFCDFNNLDFPEFIIEQYCDLEYMKIRWYSEDIIKVITSISKDHTISHCIEELSKWLESEYNFLYILKLNNSKMR